MSVRVERDRSRQQQVQDRCQRILVDLLKDDDNKYCVDCDAKGPRWASWNLGIFLCIRCAGIHRNLGVHISKVKSVNLDSWTPEQVVSLQQMGNSRARAVYEANLPDAFRRPQTDSALEAFVRAKYEHRKYVAREWVPPSPPKVNWDKEIDEELEKQKKKKKPSSSSSGSTPSAEKKSSKATSNVVPKLLPKPKSSVSPKPGRSTPKRDPAPSADLLGVTADAAPETAPSNSFGDDMFGGFLSGPQAATATPEIKSVPEPAVVDLKSEEENFFNQPAPTEKEKTKMTKDSILALYGQAPLKNIAPQFAPPVGGASFPSMFPPTGFQQQPGPFGQQAFNGFQAQPFMQNGSAQPQSFPSAGMNQFAAQPPAFSNQFQTTQFSSLQNFSANPMQNSQFPNGVFPPTANSAQPYFGGAANLSQQFGGMALNPSVSAASANAFPVQQNPVSAGFPNGAQQPNVAANGVWQ